MGKRSKKDANRDLAIALQGTRTWTLTRWPRGHRPEAERDADVREAWTVWNPGQRRYAEPRTPGMGQRSFERRLRGD